jgi:predicted transcriptional regulator
MGQITFRISQDDRERLDKIAEEEDRTVGDMLRRIVRMYCDARERGS